MVCPYPFTLILSRARLVPEMPMPVNTIAMPCSSAAAITSSSRTLPPGWMIAARPRPRRRRRRRGTGRKRPRPTTEPASASPALAALMDGDPRRVDPAHLARTHAEGPPATAEHDRVRLDEFGDAPCKQEIGDLGLARPRPGDDLEPSAPTVGGIGRLHQQPAAHALQIPARWRRAGESGHLQHADVRLALPAVCAARGADGAAR